jgi:hypothetical protein
MNNAINIDRIRTADGSGSFAPSRSAPVDL